MNPRTVMAVGASVAVVGGALWWRRNPSACPYGQRFWLAPPRPVITRARLLELLAPLPGEQMLEVGPGTGHYAVPVAARLGAAGRLDIFDIQQAMLDHTVAAAERRGLSNVVPTLGDARSLPYPDASFDGAYLVTVLGEVPDPKQALCELARVLRPGGRLVVGEMLPDPHWVSPRRLERGAAAAGLRFSARRGTALGFFARYERP